MLFIRKQRLAIAIVLWCPAFRNITIKRPGAYAWVKGACTVFTQTKFKRETPTSHGFFCTASGLKREQYNPQRLTHLSLLRAIRIALCRKWQPVSVLLVNATQTCWPTATGCESLSQIKLFWCHFYFSLERHQLLQTWALSSVLLPRLCLSERSVASTFQLGPRGPRLVLADWNNAGSSSAL